MQAHAEIMAKYFYAFLNRDYLQNILIGVGESRNYSSVPSIVIVVGNIYSAIFFSVLYLFIYWSIIALQCCVIFCYTTMWISYMYTYIPSLFRLPPTHPHSTCLNHHRAHLSFLQWPNTQRTRYRNCLNVRWCQWQN